MLRQLVVKGTPFSNELAPASISLYKVRLESSRTGTAGLKVFVMSILLALGAINPGRYPGNSNSLQSRTRWRVQLCMK